MELTLILGRAGSGKSELCLREINDRIEESAFSFPLIYLVPKQSSFQAEYALATSAPRGGSIRAQALSFKRLAWKIMQETGERQAFFLDDTGKSMLMQRILQENKRKLRLFRHAGEQPGTLAHLVQFYNEMKRYCLVSSSLGEILEQKKGEIPLLLQDKLADLSLIMGEMERCMEGHYQDGEDTLGALIRKIPESKYLDGAEIWVDGFYDFTRLEYRVLQSLLPVSRKITVTLCLDRDYPPEEKLPANSPFYSATLTMRRLMQGASALGAPCRKVFLGGKGRPRWSDNTILGHLEQNLYRFPARPCPALPGGRKTASLVLATAQKRRHEVESAARAIIRQVRDTSCRWRDIAVLAGNLEEYADLLITVFEDYEIPFFLDQRRPASHHPLVEFVRSSLEVITRGWRFDAVFRCIKTGFLFPLQKSRKMEQEWRKKASRLENYALAFGIQGGSRWLARKPWTYTGRDTLEEDLGAAAGNRQSRAEELAIQEIDEVRTIFTAPLAVFAQEFKKAEGVKGKIIAIFHLLENVSAGNRLEFWGREDLRRGNLEKSREHAQVYNGIIYVMEQLAELMGETAISSAQFLRILNTGLENLSLGLVPPSLDGVMIGDIERTRPGGIRCVFILGANDGILPARLQEDGILTGEERRNLEKAGLESAPGIRRRLLDQQFLIYMAMTRPSTLLWVSYPRADEEGRALMPSMLIAHLQDLFPFLEEEFLQMEPGSKEHPGARRNGMAERFYETLPFLVHPRQTFTLLALQLSRWRAGGSIDPLWWEVYNWYAAQERWHGEGSRLFKGLFYRNSEPPIDKDVSRLLYGERWKTGISRLESYRACPFSQFLTYGLKLRERRLYRLESLDIGRFFHMALRNVTLSLQEKEIDFTDLDDETSLSIVDEEVDELVPKLQKEILLSSARYLNLASRLKKTVGLAVLQMAEHYRRSRFRPIGVEIPFGTEEGLPALELDLDDGGQAEIVGRIDRIDLARDEQGRAYLRVIDYKSGAVDLVLAELFFGFSLQLLTYLDIALASSPQWLKEETLPAGIFYFRIYAPFVEAKKGLSPEELAAELLKQYKMKGRCLADPHVIRLMDSSLVQGFSPVLPVGLNKEGSLNKKSSVFSLEQFTVLCRHVRQVLRHAAGGIAGGQVGIQPFQLGKKRACTFCVYKAVCQFDPFLEENRFRLFTNPGEKEIWNLLLQRGEQDE